MSLLPLGGLGGSLIALGGLGDAGAIVPTTPAKDRFLGAGALLSHTSDSGHTWSASATVPASAATILSSGLVRNAIAGASVLKSSWVPGGADVAVYFDLYKASQISAAGVFARMNGFGQAYLFWYNSLSLFISKMTASGGTTNLVFASQTIAPGATLRCRATLTGSTLNLDTQDPVTAVWTTFLTTSDSTYTAAGPSGVYFFGTETDTTGTQLTKFVAMDAAATDMLVLPGNVGGAGNVSLQVRGYNTAWTPGTPGAPTYTLSHNSDTASIVSQSIIAANLASVVVNTGTSPGTFTLSDGTETSTAAVAASTSAVVNILADYQSITPHLNLYGLWSTGTLAGHASVSPALVPDYVSTLQDFPISFVALANSSTLTCMIPTGLTMYVAVDKLAPLAVVGDGTTSTLTLHSIADGKQHLVRLAPPAGSVLSDITITGAAPALTSVTKTQAFFASNITGMQCPSVASPLAVQGTGYVDQSGFAFRQNQHFTPTASYAGGILRFATTGRDADVLAAYTFQHSMEPTIDGVPAPSVAQMILYSDSTLTGTTHWVPLMTGLGAGMTHTFSGITGPIAAADMPMYAVRVGNGTATAGVVATSANSFTVVDASNIAAGDWLLLDTGSAAEVVQVTSVAGNLVSLLNSLGPLCAKVHLAGARVTNFRDPAATFAAAPALPSEDIIGLGDSETRGARPKVVRMYTPYDPTNSYLNRLAALRGANPINLGVTGNHTGDMCRRCYGGTMSSGLRYAGDGSLAAGDLPRFVTRPARYAVALGGTNDCTFGVTASDFQSNWQYIILALTDPSVLKPYSQGGRLFILMPFSSLAYNTDPGVGGTLNAVGMHVGVYNTLTDPTSYSYWIRAAINTTGVNLGRPNFVSLVDPVQTMLLGTASSLGTDMYDALHFDESGQTKVAQVLQGVITAPPPVVIPLRPPRVFHVDIPNLVGR